jgi:hypothetical protein
LLAAGELYLASRARYVESDVVLATPTNSGGKEPVMGHPVLNVELPEDIY